MWWRTVEDEIRNRRSSWNEVNKIAGDHNTWKLFMAALCSTRSKRTWKLWFHENKYMPHLKSSQFFSYAQIQALPVIRQFIQTNIFRTSFSAHFKHCSFIYTYRHITANTIVLNVYVFVLFSSTSIISSVTPASHLIHLTVWAPRLIVVWAYLDLYFKHIIKPLAEYKFRDYLMIVSQLQALCNVQQWNALMSKSDHVFN
jgi:hypothetical protein